MKLIIVFTFLSQLILANCTYLEKKEVVKLWQTSLHKKDLDEKSYLLDKAIEKKCGNKFDFIVLDSFVLKGKRFPSKLTKDFLEVLKN